MRLSPYFFYLARMLNTLILSNLNIQPAHYLKVVYNVRINRKEQSGLLDDDFVCRIERVRLDRKDGVSKVMGTIACVAGASVITLYKGPTIFGGASKTLHATYWVSQDLPSLGDASAKNWTLGCLYLVGHCLSWSGWLVFQAPVLKKYPARLSVTSYTCFFGVLQFLVIAAFIERDLKAWMFHSGGEVFTILYAVLYSIDKISQLPMFTNLIISIEYVRYYEP